MSWATTNVGQRELRDGCSRHNGVGETVRGIAKKLRILILPLVLALFCEIGDPIRAFAKDPRADRFPKITVQGADRVTAEGAQAAIPQGFDAAADRNAVDFYNEFIKGKTVIINFFYTKCSRICNEGTRNLVQVQKALGDRLGREVFIYSITLDPDQDTPEVLKAYAEEHGAKPGWMFLRMNAKDLEALREKLGLSNLSPELSRKLFPASAAEAKSTIEAKSPMKWESNALRALVGDVIEWKMGAGTPGRHGVRIANWTAVKDYVEVEKVDGQQPFDAATGQNVSSTTIAGKVLLRLKVKSEPQTPLRLTYECIEHGDQMIGELSLGQPHSAMMFIYNDSANRRDTLPILAAPNQILESIERMRPRERP